MTRKKITTKDRLKSETPDYFKRLGNRFVKYGVAAIALGASLSSISEATTGSTKEVLFIAGGVLGTSGAVAAAVGKFCTSLVYVDKEE